VDVLTDRPQKQQQEKLKTDAEIDGAVKNEANYRDSDGYKAVIIKNQERFLALTKKFNFVYSPPLALGVGAVVGAGLG
jgi:hypothetical protein